MLTTKKALYAVFFSIFITATASGQTGVENPYEILNEHFLAMGGLDRLKAERSQYYEADLSIGGLEGELKYWEQKPGKVRTEADLGILKFTQGKNTDYDWILDQNGKLQKITNFDDAAIKRRQLKLLIDEYKYADPNLRTFAVKYINTDEIDGQPCYIIEITNTINTDKLTMFINTDNYLLEKIISIEGVESHDAYYDDYREVDGLMVAFRVKEVHHSTGQDQLVSITQYVSNPEIDQSIFEAPDEIAKDYHFTYGNSAENIPIRFVENHIYVPVIIDCRETMWILDTGAGMSVIAKKFADKLGLKHEGDIKGAGAGGQVDVSFAKLPSYRLQGITFDEQTVAVIDMSELNKVLGIKIDGILGYDFLSRFVTKVDYANETISLFDPDSFTYSGDGREIGLYLKENQFKVESTLDDKYTGTWLFDLGASGISINAAYANSKHLNDKKGVEGMGHGAANYFYYKNIKFENITFAGFKVNNPKASFHTGSTDTISTSDEIGGLGNSLFRHFTIYCDYANERLIFEKGENFNKDFPEDHSGILLARTDNDELEVVFVPNNTPAKDAGFKKGDIIREINAIDVALFDGLTAVRKLLAEKTGTKFTFVVERNGEEKKLKLKLRDLY